MKTILATLIGAACAYEAIDPEFMVFLAEHGKDYHTVEEFEVRKALWKKTDDLIKSHKSDSYEVGHNHMSDWTAEEYSGLMGYKPERRTEPKNEPTMFEEAENATGIDWRTKGAVTPVKD